MPLTYPAGTAVRVRFAYDMRGNLVEMNDLLGKTTSLPATITMPRVV
ncbi:MAG: hypothetical protein ACFFCW_15855 [Candidatus Hodarchaeota archaeon]